MNDSLHAESCRTDTGIGSNLHRLEAIVVACNIIATDESLDTKYTFVADVHPIFVAHFQKRRVVHCLTNEGDGSHGGILVIGIADEEVVGVIGDHERFVQQHLVPAFLNLRCGIACDHALSQGFLHRTIVDQHLKLIDIDACHQSHADGRQLVTSVRPEGCSRQSQGCADIPFARQLITCGGGHLAVAKA